jgi:hypothetical protein
MLQIPIVATTRRMRMKAAQLELTTSIGDIAEKHQLAFAELYMLLADEMKYLAGIELTEAENREAGAEKGKGKNGK